MLTLKYTYGYIYGKEEDLTTLYWLLTKKWYHFSPYKLDTLALVKLIDMIFVLVEVKLGLFPEMCDFHITVLPDITYVDKKKIDLYGTSVKNLGRKAFASLSRKTMYVSAQDINSKIIAHEFGHLIFQALLVQKPSYKLHEIVARYSETAIK